MRRLIAGALAGGRLDVGCSLVLVGLLALGGPVACSDDEGGIGTSAELTAALSEAAPGDVLSLQGAVFRGSFEVPAGVGVVGRQGTTVIAEGGAAFRLDSGGDEPTVLRDLTVETEAGAALVGVLGGGDGAVVLDGITVEAGSGIGIAVQGPSSLTIADGEITGTLTDDFLAGAASGTFDPAEIAVAGLVVVGGESAGPTNVSITKLEIRDTAGFGAVFAGVGGEWSGGRVTGVAGTGVLAEASAMTFADLTIHDVRKSPIVGALDLAFGLVMTAGSEVDTDGLQVARVDGFGVLQDAAESTHQRARIVANEGPGLWIQNAAVEPVSSIDFALSESVVQGNEGVGVQLLDLRRAEISGTLVCDTRGRPAISGTAGFRIVSDGVQVSTTTEGALELAVADTALFGNGRVGVLLDGDGAAASASSEAGPLTLCGHTEIGEGWECAIDEDARRTCLRQGGPRVGPDWTCSDGAEGTTCTTDVAALADAEPQVEAVLTPTAGLPESDGCRAGVRDVIDAYSLVPGVGLLDELDEAEPRAFIDDQPEWECETTGATRTCIDRHGDQRIRVDDRDNPSLVGAPGWDCDDTDEGRRCLYSGNGLLARDGASAAIDVVEIADIVAQRDAAVLAAELQETDVFGVHASLATVCDADDVCVGLAGRGVLGDATLVGDDGIVSEDGGVQALLGEEGFERR